LVYKSLSTTDLRLPTTKLICLNSHFGAAAFSALMMLICFCFFHLWEPLVPVCRPSKFSNIFDPQSLIDCDPIRSPAPETIYEERLWIEVIPCLLIFLTGIVTSISCAFYASSSLLQILRNSSRRHSVLMLLSLSSVTNLSLLFGFCAACMLSYRYLQMEWWAAVTVVAIPSQPALLM